MAEQKFESYETGDNTQDTITAAYIRGETFTPLVSHNIQRVEIKIYKWGSPSGTGKVSIRATDGEGLPIEGDLTYVEFPIPGDLPTEAAWVSFDLPSYLLNQGQMYALLLWGVGEDLGNSLKWRLDSADGAYPRGTYISSGDGGETWAKTLAMDFIFKEFGELPPAAGGGGSPVAELVGMGVI